MIATHYIPGLGGTIENQQRQERPNPSKQPTCNPYAERFVRTIRTERLDHLVVFGERHLRVLLREFCAHYHGERNHQGLGNRLIEPLAANTNSGKGVIPRRERLGGVLNYYYREAA